MEKTNDNQDLLLVRQCLEGSENAWNEFYSKFIGLMRSVVRRQGKLSDADVEDVTQSAFLALTTALTTYDSRHSLAGFVCLVTERVLIDEFRRIKAAKRKAQTEAVEHHDGGREGSTVIQADTEPQDCQMERFELVALLRTALEKLDPKCRDLIKLRYLNELPYSEIAGKLGESENTLTVRARRCLDKLRAEYKDLERKGVPF